MFSNRTSRDAGSPTQCLQRQLDTSQNQMAYISIYDTGRTRYFVGYSLLLFSAVIEFVTRSVVDSSFTWPNPLPLLLFQSLFLYYSDAYRKTIGIVFIALGLVMFLNSLVGPMLTGQKIRYSLVSLALINGIILVRVGWVLRRSGTQRIFLLFKYVDDLDRRRVHDDS